MSRTPQSRPDNRTIPESVRRALRSEVNFGCPVPNCGNPYLTYHHFDPPYREGHSHDHQGMIALCLPHHKAADVDTWTAEQLRAMKTGPFLTGKTMSGKLNWMRRDVIVLAGGNLALNPTVLLEVDSQKLVWTTRADDGSLRLNVNLAGSDGQDLIRLVDNEWIVTGEVQDLRASASANSIRVSAPSRGVTLEIRFSTLCEDALRVECEQCATEQAGKPRVPLDLIPLLPPGVLARATPTRADVFDELWEPFAASGISWPAMRVTVTGRIAYPVPIKLTQTKLAVRGNRVFGGNKFFDPNATLLSVTCDGEIKIVGSQT